MMEGMIETKEERDTIRLLCVGDRTFKGDRVESAFVRLDAEDRPINGLDSVVAWSKMHGDAGIIYEVKIPKGGDGGTVYSRTLTVVGTWRDRDQGVSWRAQGRAAKAEAGAAKQRERIRTNAKAEAELAALREAYQETGWSARSAFLAAVIEEITRGRR